MNVTASVLCLEFGLNDIQSEFLTHVMFQLTLSKTFSVAGLFPSYAQFLLGLETFNAGVILNNSAYCPVIDSHGIGRDTLQAEPAFPHSPPSSMLFFCQSVLLENTSSAWLGYVFVEHARSFHDNAKIFKPIKLTLDYYEEMYIRRIMEWNACLLHMFERFT